MMHAGYISLAREARAEIIEKKSRFTAFAGRVETEADAKNFIEKIKNTQKEASHHVYAYITGKDVPTARFSDDGEPHGTAGMPVLETIKSNGITDSIIVVVRYFGGTLLGTGGLARAYSAAAAKAVKKAGTAEFIPAKRAVVDTDYHYLGKIKHFIETSGYPQVDEKYADNVIIDMLVPVEETDRFRDGINALTNAKADVEFCGSEYIKRET